MITLNLTGLVTTPELRRDQEHLAAVSDADGPGLVKRRGRTGYRSLADQLWTLQHDKCGYCESLLEERADEVDHIRPKDPGMYWWLAFSLRNLLMACRSCNNFKASRFDLRPGATRLIPRQAPWEVDEPSMLVDPTIEDPRLHITFLLQGGEWRIAGVTDRGLKTIEMLSLDRASLTTKTNRFVAEAIDPLVENLLRARARGARAEVLEAIGSLITLTAPGRQWSHLLACVVRAVRDGRYPE